MIQLLPYNRRAAVSYAHKWAYSRNPAFYDFSEIGGDCTNFASQCLYAGTGIMNFTPEYGWYYIDATDRAPAWTGGFYPASVRVQRGSICPHAGNRVGGENTQAG